MKYRVTDTIAYSDSWIWRYDNLAARGKGLLTIFDPAQLNVSPKIEGYKVTIWRPEGSTAQFEVFSIEERLSAVGFFFKDATQEDIPVGSQIEW